MSYRTNTFDVEIPSIESARNTLLRFIVTFLFLTFSIPLLSSNGQTSSGTDKQGGIPKISSHWLDPDGFARQHGRNPLPDPMPPSVSETGVGRTPGNFWVNEDGSVTYNVPIQVLPGRRGVQPNLSLVYQSRGGSGMLGLRWKLAGLSSIARTGQNLADDGCLRRVNFDDDDRFALDGNRLVAIEGTYGDHRTEYRTKQDMFARIISFRSTSTRRGPDRFEVHTKDGTVLIYGRNDRDLQDTALVMARRGVARAWLLSEVRNSEGNAWHITYINDKNPHQVDLNHDGIPESLLSEEQAETVEVVPFQIWYTTNDTPESPRYGQRFVYFVYDAHPDPRHGYFAGVVIENKRRLREIQVGIQDPDVGRRVLKTYRLDYTEGLIGSEGDDNRAVYPEGFPPRGRMLLERINELDEGGVPKAPIEFHWQQGATVFGERFDTGIEAPETAVSGEDSRAFMIPIDINGDGYTDLMYPKVHRGTSCWHLRLNDRTNNFTAEEALITFPTGEPATRMYFINDQLLSPLGRSIDWDGDGHMDLLLNDASETWTVLRNLGTGESPYFELINTGIEIGDINTMCNTSRASCLPDYKAQFTYLQDLNGDGLPDLICRTLIGSYVFDEFAFADWMEESASALRWQWRYRLHTGKGFDPDHEQIIWQLEDTASRDKFDLRVKPLFLDYDGNGSVDLLVYQGNESRNEYEPGFYQGFSFESGLPVPFGTNLPHFTERIGGTLVWEPSGDCGVGGDDPCIMRFRLRQNVGPVFLMDLNGDGLSDVLQARQSTDANFINLLSWTNTGDGFYGGLNGNLVAGVEPRDHYFLMASVMDYNFDGRDDLLVPEFLPGGHPEKTWKVLLAPSHPWGPLPDGPPYGFSQYSYDFGEILYVNPLRTPPSIVHDRRAPAVVDMNGDQIPDLFTFDDHHLVVNLNRSPAPYLITKIRDYPVVEREDWRIEVQYAPTTDPAVYTSTPAPAVPRDMPLALNAFKMRPPMIVVKNYSIDNGPGRDRLHYRRTYHDSRFDHYLGWLGFGQTTFTDEQTGAVTTTAFDNYNHHDADILYPYGFYPQRGRPLYQLVEAEDDDGRRYNTFLSYQYFYRLLHSGCTWFVMGNRQSSRIEFIDLDGSCQTLRSTDRIIRNEDVDNHGNITRITQEVGQNDERHTITTMYTYDLDYTCWLMGRIKEVTVEWQKPDRTAISRRIELDYEPGTTLVREFHREPGNPSYAQTRRYERDEFGNVTKAMVEARDSKGHLETNIYEFIYDVFEKMNPHMVFDSEGNLTRYAFNEMGQPIIFEDENMLITRFGYDGHFRPTQCEYLPTCLQSTTRYKTEDIRENGHLHLVTETTWEVPDGPLDYVVKSTFDRLGRAVHNAHTAFDGNWSVTSLQYDDRGQLGRVYLPASRSESERYNPGDVYLDYQYDRLNRPLEVRDSCGNHTFTNYLGKRLDRTDSVGNTTTYHYNTLGQLIRVTDSINRDWKFGYGAFGLIEKLEDPAGNTFILHYDLLGRIKGKEDPSATGFYIYGYDGFDRLTLIEDPKFVRTHFEYDRLGRLTIRRDPEAVLKYSYDDTVRRARGKLWSVKTPTNEKRYTYNDQGLVMEITNRVGGENYTDRFSYDAFGRLIEHEFPWGPPVPDGEVFRRVPFAVRYHFQCNLIQRVSDRNEHNPADETQSYWRALERDAAGRVRRELFGNGIETTYEFENNGCAFGYSNLTAIRSPIQDLTYEYYPDGSLQARVAGGLPIVKRQEFTYDKLLRLQRIITSNTATGGVEETQSVEYDAIGNIKNRSDVGSYYYEPPHGYQPHAVTRVLRPEGSEENYTYDSAGFMTSMVRPRQRIDIETNNFGKPRRIDVNSQKIEFEYDAFLNRVRKLSESSEIRYLGGLTHSRIFDDTPDHEVYRYNLGNFEVIWEQRGEEATRSILYKHLDHLGSLNVISDSIGTPSDHLFFDSFGWPRQQYFNGPRTNLSHWGCIQGFTGHEHDEDFGLNLINTGGRLYNAGLGRFTSPDPVIQFPENGQSHNAYSYVLNNPMTFTDPTGYEVVYDAGGLTWFMGGESGGMSFPFDIGQSGMSDPFWDDPRLSGGPSSQDISAPGAPSTFDNGGMSTTQAFSDTGLAGAPGGALALSPVVRHELREILQGAGLLLRSLLAPLALDGHDPIDPSDYPSHADYQRQVHARNQASWMVWGTAGGIALGEGIAAFSAARSLPVASTSEAMLTLNPADEAIVTATIEQVLANGTFNGRVIVLTSRARAFGGLTDDAAEWAAGQYADDLARLGIDAETINAANARNFVPPEFRHLFPNGRWTIEQNWAWVRVATQDGAIGVLRSPVGPTTVLHSTVLNPGAAMGRHGLSVFGREIVWMLTAPRPYVMVGGRFLVPRSTAISILGR